MLVLALLLAQAAPQAVPDIVVRGRRTFEALEACLARDCSAPDDARFAIAHAEALFAKGDYVEARRTLSAALSRQSAAARRFPRIVAALYEANATVNLHLGDMGRYRTATIAQARTLRENLPPDDPQVLLAAVRLGDFWIKQHQPLEAKRQFEAAARSYARRGDDRLHALCLLRVVAVEIALREFSAAGKRLGAISRSPVSTDPTVRQLGAIIAARLASARGEEADVEALLATLRTDPSAPPMLVRPGNRPMYGGRATHRDLTRLGGPIRMQPGGVEVIPVRWADVGFMVGPDGRVGDVEVLRGSRTQTWTVPYLEEIAGRRYAPLDLTSGVPGLYRVEHFTLRAEREVPTMSLIKQASGPVYVETVDMTRDDAVSRKAE